MVRGLPASRNSDEPPHTYSQGPALAVISTNCPSGPSEILADEPRRELNDVLFAKFGVLVPQNAVSHNQKGEPTALVVDQKNFARLRLLRTGRAVGNQWQVLEGLKPGDRLITEGLAKAMPDMPVNPQPAGQAPKPAAAAR